MKIIAGEVAEYLYFLLIGIAFLVSSTIYWRNLDKIRVQEPVPEAWQTPSTRDSCVHNVFPAGEFGLFDFVPSFLTPDTDGWGNETTLPTLPFHTTNGPVDVPQLQICADVNEWKYYAVLGLIAGGLCLLQNPWFKMINCHSGPGRKRARKLTKKSIKSTPGAKLINKANPRLGIILYQRAETDDKQKKDKEESVAKTCCFCLYGCSVIWIALAYIVASMAIPIYVLVNLLRTEALKPMDTNLSRPALALVITSAVHVFCFFIIMCSVARQIIRELTKIRETNIDQDEDALWEEMQRKARIVASNNV